MIDKVKSVERKWQKRWAESKVFESEPCEKKKFFATYPYPYINCSPHVGHGYSAIRNDMVVRYKRMLGYNTLFPIGLHATGEPITGAAKRVAMNDPSQIKALKLSGIPDGEIPKFKDPLHVIKYFKDEWIGDFKGLGLAVDWRRTFFTTSLNREYNSFVQWQFNILKKKGLIVRGSHPVVYCPSCDSPTQSHDRKEGENATIEEFTLLKFRYKNDYLIASTFRPETVFGQTNLWINPDAVYKKIKVGNEVWIVSAEASDKIRNQKDNVAELEEIRGSEFLYEKVVAPMIHREIPVLPASFCDPKVGTGIVTSVPSDAPYDYIALKDLKAEIKPVPIIRTEGWGEFPAITIIDKLGIKSQDDREKLEQATKIVYKAGFHKGVMNENCGKYAGMKVETAKEKVKREMLKNNEADLFYETSEPVVCRCLTSCFVKKLKNQWFINYADEKWKRKSLQCLKGMNVYPGEVRKAFENAINNCKAKACSRRSGLGTPLPWDGREIIEPLSDSTIYMSYYIISKYVTQGVVDVSNMSPEFFDYILLNKGSNPYKRVGLKKGLVERIKREFEYFYPVDLRSTGKDLINHHMIFFIYNHIAIFPKKHWPKSVGANGWITVDGMKMSKSLGNFVSLRDAIDSYGADASRLGFLDSAEGIVDADFVRANAVNFSKKMLAITKQVRQDLKGKGKADLADEWLLSRIQGIITKTREHMDVMENRSALQKSFHEFLNIMNVYRSRKKSVNSETLKYVWSVFARLNVPFTPHLCEEVWELIGGKGFVHNAEWPAARKSLVKTDVESAFELYEMVKNDVNNIVKLTRKKPGSIRVIVAPAWKYGFFKKLKRVMEKETDVSRIIRNVMIPEHGKEIGRIVPAVLKDRSKIPENSFTQAKELEMLRTQSGSFKDEFGAEIIIETAEESNYPKGLQASPSKPAIILE